MNSPPIKRKETSYSMRSERRSSGVHATKVGLAKLAKTRSLSSSTGNLLETEDSFDQFSGSGPDKASKPKACVLTNPSPSLTTLTSAKPPSTPVLKKAPSSFPKMPPPSHGKSTKKVSRQESVVLLSNKSFSSPQLSTTTTMGSNAAEHLLDGIGVCEVLDHLSAKVYDSSETGPAENPGSEERIDKPHEPEMKAVKNKLSVNSPKAAYFFLPEEPDDDDDYDNEDLGKTFESAKPSGRRSRLSKAPLASFDDSFDTETSSESHDCRSVTAPASVSSKKNVVRKFSAKIKCVNPMPGVHSHGDLVDYALLHRKRSSELESTGLLNRHIGSIRRFLGRTSASAHASPDRGSPVIKLSEAKEEATEGNVKRRSTRRRLSGGSSKELSVPTSMLRSNSLNMLSEAFSAVHNLCVVPANAGATAQEQGRRRSCSMSPAPSGSPALSSSPPASCSPSSLNVASGSPQGGVWFSHSSKCGVQHRAPHGSINNPSFESHSSSYARSPAMSDSRISSSNVDGALLITNSCDLNVGEIDQNGRFIVANIDGDEPILLPKSPLAYNEFPVTTGHTKFNFTEKKTKLRKKKKALGDTLRRLREGSVSPSSSVHSSRENSSSVSLDTTPPSDADMSITSVDRNSSNGRNSNASTVNSTPSKSSCGLSSSVSTVNSTPSKSGSSSSSQSLPLLMAQPDRCGCSQPTPSLCRSSAFRDSKRNAGPSPMDVPASDISKSGLSSSDPTPSDQSLSSSACASASVQSSLVSSNSSGRSTVVHNVLGSSSSGHSHDSLVSHFSSALSDESLRSTEHDRSSGGISDCNLNGSDKNRSPKHRPKPDIVATPTKKRAVRCSSSPPVTVKELPQAAPRSFGSLQSLEEGVADDENEVKLRSKDSRRNRKERVNRNRNAQIFHSKRHNGVDPQVLTSSYDDPRKNLTKDATDQSGAVISTPSSGYHSSCSSSAALPASASCQEIPAILRTKKTSLERTGRPQSWGSGNVSSLPGVAAAIGTMMAGASGTITPQESPCHSPSMLSPAGSLERLDLEDDLDDNEEPPASSATAAILGAINTSEMRARKISICTPEMMARSYLYGGLDFLLGPRELDRCLPERSITVFIATWNMNGKEPPSALDHLQLGQELEDVPDVYVVGTQESGVERRAWEVRLQACVGQQHVLLTSAALGILHLNIFVRRDLIWFFSMPEEGYHSLRPGTYFKTKGATAICFQFFGTRFLFVNSHLFAHEEKYAQRIQNIKNISHALDLPRTLPVKHKYKDATKRFDCVFWLGDLNFRLVANRDHVLQKIAAGVDVPGTVKHLLQWDQLSNAKSKGETFIDFEEGEITFAPTFKYDPGTDSYDSSSKQRVPSYTDRILFKSPRSSISCLEYDSSPMFRSSDHKPVWGRYRCQIRPGKDNVPLNAGQFNREVYVDALKRRRKMQQQLLRGGEEPEEGCSLQ